MEQNYQVIGNIISTFDMSDIVHNNPWSGILAATIFAIRVTYHTTLQASPMQLGFGQYVILIINNIINWEHIQQHKQE